MLYVDTGACGDGDEQSRKRKLGDISPIKWTSADAEAAEQHALGYCFISVLLLVRLWKVDLIKWVSDVRRTYVVRPSVHPQKVFPIPMKFGM